MSVASSAAAQTGTSIVGPAAGSITNAESPISQLIPYITSAFSWFKYFLSIIISFRPPLLFWPLPILLYLFAPVVVFSEMVMIVFFSGPYKIILYLLEALYPLYVLVGVACITGGVLGLVGRQICRLLVRLLRVRSEGNSRRTRGEVDLKGKRKIEVKLEP